MEYWREQAIINVETALEITPESEIKIRARLESALNHLRGNTVPELKPIPARAAPTMQQLSRRNNARLARRNKEST